MVGSSPNPAMEIYAFGQETSQRLTAVWCTKACLHYVQADIDESSLQSSDMHDYGNPSHFHRRRRPIDPASQLVAREADVCAILASRHAIDDGIL